MPCETPAPSRWIRLETSWSPVPDAATSPTCPRRTRFAKPSPTPLTRLVPHSGPITRSPRAPARRLSAISSASGTPSLKRNTWRPGRERLVGLGRRVGAGHRHQGHVGPGQPPSGADDRARRLAPLRRPASSRRAARNASASARAASAAAALSARTAMTRSAGPARLASAGQEVGLVEQPAVQVGRHHQRGRADAGERPDALGDLHERHRVDEGVGPHPAPRHHGRSSRRRLEDRPPRGGSPPSSRSRTTTRPRARRARPRRDRRGAAARRAADESGHGLEELAPARVREPGAPERRGAALGARDDGGRHDARAPRRRGPATRRPGSRPRRSRRGGRRPTASARGRAPPGRARPAPRIARRAGPPRPRGAAPETPSARSDPAGEPARVGLGRPEERAGATPPPPPRRPWRARPAADRPGLAGRAAGRGGAAPRSTPRSERHAPVRSSSRRALAPTPSETDLADAENPASAERRRRGARSTARAFGASGTSGVERIRSGPSSTARWHARRWTPSTTARPPASSRSRTHRLTRIAVEEGSGAGQSRTLAPRASGAASPLPVTAGPARALLDQLADPGRARAASRGPARRTARARRRRPRPPAPAPGSRRPRRRP